MLFLTWPCRTGCSPCGVSPHTARPPWPGPTTSGCGPCSPSTGSSPGSGGGHGPAAGRLKTPGYLEGLTAVLVTLQAVEEGLVLPAEDVDGRLLEELGHNVVR